MRVTIDSDGGKLSLLWKLFKGVIVCRKMPAIEKSVRGYHLIWKGLPISWERSLVYRKFIGDDGRRLKFDLNPKRLGQVLFNKKVVFIRKRGKWAKVKNCEICALPLTKYYKKIGGKFYCRRCGKGNVVLKKAIAERHNHLFNRLLGVKALNI